LRNILVTALITVLMPGAGPPAQRIATASFMFSLFTIELEYVIAKNVLKHANIQK
jgi:hypothetical protein